MTIAEGKRKGSTKLTAVLRQGKCVLTSVSRVRDYVVLDEGIGTGVGDAVGPAGSHEIRFSSEFGSKMSTRKGLTIDLD
jgi:hypothetical protein